MTTLEMSRNTWGITPSAVQCIADGLGSNSTLLKIDLSHSRLNIGVGSIPAQTLGSRNTTLQKLRLLANSISSTGVSVLLETMERGNNQHITDLELRSNFIRNEGVIFIARPLENNALPNLTRISLSNCDIGDDGFIL
jgi:Ran GTPase-activating protein (RanGAP) involved in mRNA processing and transport